MPILSPERFQMLAHHTSGASRLVRFRTDRKNTTAVLAEHNIWQNTVLRRPLLRFPSDHYTTAGHRVFARSHKHRRNTKDVSQSWCAAWTRNESKRVDASCHLRASPRCVIAFSCTRTCHEYIYIYIYIVMCYNHVPSVANQHRWGLNRMVIFLPAATVRTNRLAGDTLYSLTYTCTQYYIVLLNRRLHRIMDIYVYGMCSGNYCPRRKRYIIIIWCCVVSKGRTNKHTRTKTRRWEIIAVRQLIHEYTNIMYTAMLCMLKFT